MIISYICDHIGSLVVWNVIVCVGRHPQIRLQMIEVWLLVICCSVMLLQSNTVLLPIIQKCVFLNTYNKWLLLRWAIRMYYRTTHSCKPAWFHGWRNSIFTRPLWLSLQKTIWEKWTVSHSHQSKAAHSVKREARWRIASGVQQNAAHVARPPGRDCINSTAQVVLVFP